MLNLEGKKHYNNKAIIELQNISFEFSNTFQITNISAKIRKGEILAITGENGSGKTTLLKLIIGLLKPKTGEIYLNEKILNSLSWEEKTRNIGVVFQDSDKQFFEDNTLNEILLVSKNLSKEISKTELDKSILESGLSNLVNFNPFSLSHGEKKRLAFLSAIQHNPEILILDEITSGLDNKNKSWIQEQIKYLASKGTTIILISHDWEWIKEIADTMIGLENGQIKFQIRRSKLENKLKEIEKSIDKNR